MSDGPLIVQSDRTVLLEVAHADAESARATNSRSSPSWNEPPSTSTPTGSPASDCGTQRAAGHTAEDMLETLDRWSRFPVPPSVSVDLRETVNRYGRLVIERDDEGTLILRSSYPAVLAQVANNKRIQPLLIGHPTPEVFVVDAWARGQIKQELLRSAGLPRISPVTHRALRTRSTSPRTAGTSAPISRTPSTPSRRTDRASWSCPAARARRSSAPARWRRPRPPR